MTAQPTPAIEGAVQPLHQMDLTPKTLTVDSTWGEILSELHLIQAELSAINKMEKNSNVKNNSEGQSLFR